MKRLLLTALISSAVATPAMAAKYLQPATTTESTAPAKSTPAPVAPATVLAAETARTAAPAAPSRAAPAASSFYIGAQLGDSTIGALLGYQFTRMYSMEISYDYVDPIYTPPSKLEKSRAGISALAMFPIKFSEMGPMAIYIKVGYGRTTEKLTLDDPGLGAGFPATTSVTTTLTTGVTGGAGVHVDLSSNSSARLGMSAVGSDKSAYLALLYKF